jgi:hypothetical protein
MTYQPSPIDTSHIELGPELAALIELLARNNHELWARRRIEEGWRWGPQRDDGKKETPLLVPYEQLPESEKQYDRDNAIETLKVILALGGKIVPPPVTPPRP